ncbi:hypothetical protein LEN26_017061 [Aphanomyces euteiches]|nr:hypothetical protein LEN26_017061 [Aphanomyces euteiches]KAH9193509.1 hypothetical protein AeNC1_004511 [Aphanomyces euteiches]
MKTASLLVLVCGALLASAQGNNNATTPTVTTVAPKAPTTPAPSTTEPPKATPTQAPTTEAPKGTTAATPAPTKAPANTPGATKTDAPKDSTQPPVVTDAPPKTDNIVATASPAATAASPPADSDNSHTTTYIIVGCVVGGVAILALIFFLCRRSRKDQATDDDDVSGVYHASKGVADSYAPPVRVLSPSQDGPASAPSLPASTAYIATQEAPTSIKVVHEPPRHEAEPGFLAWQSSSNEIPITIAPQDSLDDYQTPEAGRTSWTSDVGSHGNHSSPNSHLEDLNNVWVAASTRGPINSYMSDSGRNSYTSESRNSYGSDLREENSSFLSDGVMSFSHSTHQRDSADSYTQAKPPPRPY